MIDVVGYMGNIPHAMGNLAENETATIVVHPARESELAIEFSDVSGGRTSMRCGGYFEPGYHGDIYVRVESNGTSSMSHTVSVAKP